MKENYRGNNLVEEENENQDPNFFPNPLSNQKRNKKHKSTHNKSEKKKGDLNFKKWLLTLSSIGNLILGALLLIMGISALRLGIDSIFVAHQGLIVLAVIIILSSILCFIGLSLHSFFCLLIVFYNYILTIVFLSVFALGAVTMNPNLIDWIDTHWDMLRPYVGSFDMNKFKDHVTREVNSLGIFSLTLIAIVGVSMACITNFLKIKNIVFALSGPINLIFSCLSFGLIIIGVYSYRTAFYSSIPRWSCLLIIVLGCLFCLIGIFGWVAVNKMNRHMMLVHLISLTFCFLGSIVAAVGIFNMSGMVFKNLDKHWGEISEILSKEGYNIRKSYLINQLQIQLKLNGFYLIAFLVFTGISFAFSLYQYINVNNIVKNLDKNQNYLSNYLSKDGSRDGSKDASKDISKDLSKDASRDHSRDGAGMMNYT